MSKKTIDLGRPREDYGMTMPAPPEPETKEPKVDYPSLYLSDREELPEFPEEGYALIKYKVRGRNESERDGKKTCSVDLDIINFTPQDDESESSDADDVEEGLSKAEKSTKKK